MAFIILISVFILVIINFALYYKEEEERKDRLYQELLDTHKKLKEYTYKVEELTAVEERNRIARDIHDTLGHSMTAIIMEMEIIDRILDKDLNEAKTLLAKTKKSAREGLVKIREVVETLKPDDRISQGIESIKELIEDFSRRTGVEIELQVVGNLLRTSPPINATLYRAIQESITNAVRHGKATIIDIKIEFQKEKMEFYIHNNGLCPKEIIEGYGIKGMKERIEALNGKVEFEGNESFTIKGFLPIGGSEVD